MDNPQAYGYGIYLFYTTGLNDLTLMDAVRIRTVFKIRSTPTRECDLLKPCDMAAPCENTCISRVESKRVMNLGGNAKGNSVCRSEINGDERRS